MKELDIIVVEEGVAPRVQRPVWLVPALIAAAGLLPAAAVVTAVASSDPKADVPAAAVVLTTAGQVAAVVALMLLMLQLALSSRLGLLDKAFGLDRLMRIHRIVGATAATLACLHPMLVYFMGPRLKDVEAMVTFLDWHGWPEVLGVAALTLLCIVVVLSVWRKFLELPYHVWYRLHLVVYAATAAGVVHAMLRGSDMDFWWVKGFWALAAGAYTALLVWSRILRPAHLRRRPFTVASVKPLNDTVSQVTLKAPDGRRLDHHPGQFAFIKLHSRDVPAEEHPFTISSAPRQDGTMTLTVKASGDWTTELPHAMTGDRVFIDGPYGRFSYRFHSSPGQQILLIAGGIGITPMLSMLEHLAEVEPNRSVALVWANRSESDMFANDQLRELQDRMPVLGVHHVLSRQDDWPGRTGHVDAQMLRQLIGNGDCDPADEVFLCGPTEMMDATTKALVTAGFSKKKIHTERFAL